MAAPVCVRYAAAMLFWIIIGVCVLLLVARLVVGPAPRKPRPSAPGRSPAEEPEPWTATALAERGTPEAAEDLSRQGRADELRGLGYRGDIPGDDRE